MPFNPEKYWRNSIKYSARRKTKSLRKLVKQKIRQGEWDSLPKKLPVVPDDGT